MRGELRASTGASAPKEISDALRFAAQSFEVDRVTAEVTAAFRARGIDSILLKGPSIATWLYPDGDPPRTYSDSDLLVQSADWEAAQEVVRELRFHDSLGPLAHPRMESGEGYPWTRDEDGADVDLHCTLYGLGAAPDRVWEVLSSTAATQAVGGIEVRVLSQPARLVHIALHAVQHGGQVTAHTMRDLERALLIASPEEWTRARDLADSLGGSDAFVAGLRLTPDGQALANRMNLRSQGSPDALLRLHSAPIAEGLEELARAQGLRAKLRLIAREIVPTPEFMRWWTPIARRGPLGLALAYPWRVVWLARNIVPGFRAWRRVRREASSGRP